MKLAIIILNYNNAKDTIACVNSILSFSDDQIHIYIVDNNSSDSSFFLLTQAFNEHVNRNLTIIQHSINGGYAAGNNYGICYAREKFDYDYYWILNNDTVVPGKSFEELRKYTLANQDMELIGTVQVFYDRPDFIQSAGGRYHAWSGICRDVYKNKAVSSISSRVEHADYPSGASLLIKKTFLDKVGMLNETYFLYFEEIDWINRARKVYPDKFWGICARCIILHKEGGTDKNQGKGRSLLSEYYFHRNRILITSHYYSQFLVTMVFFLCFSICKRLVLMQMKSALNVYKALKDGFYYVRKHRIPSARI